MWSFWTQLTLNYSWHDYHWSDGLCTIVHGSVVVCTWKLNLKVRFLQRPRNPEFEKWIDCKNRSWWLKTLKIKHRASILTLNIGLIENLNEIGSSCCDIFGITETTEQHTITTTRRLLKPTFLGLWTSKRSFLHSTEIPTSVFIITTRSCSWVKDYAKA